MLPKFHGLAGRPRRKKYHIAILPLGASPGVSPEARFHFVGFYFLVVILSIPEGTLKNLASTASSTLPASRKRPQLCLNSSFSSTGFPPAANQEQIRKISRYVPLTSRVQGDLQHGLQMPAGVVCRRNRRFLQRLFMTHINSKFLLT
jgi:hypothetical protein